MEKPVITRIWHGMTSAKDADKYLQYVIETGVADYKRTKGTLASRYFDGSTVKFVIFGRLRNGKV